MNEKDLRVILAAIDALATVNPANIQRNRNRGGRVGVYGPALAALADAVAEARPDLMAEARHLHRCQHCGHQPWQDYHDDTCPRRTHVLYDGNGRAHPPAS